MGYGLVWYVALSLLKVTEKQRERENEVGSGDR